MPISNERKVLDYLYKRKYENEIYDFRKLIENAALSEISYDVIEAERYVDTNINRIWRLMVKEYNEDVKSNIVPIFDIVDDYAKTVRWIGVHATDLDHRKRHFYEIRPDLFDLVKSMTDREYEALACVLCKILGANNYYLTDPGNEGGIDFIATIKFSYEAHYFFGIKGPIRIIGQCKKYCDKDKIGHMKEFIQTLQHVYNLSYRPGEILPSWFKATSGPIIGWHIANAGHQSGAVDLAKNHGILTSSTKDIIDLICRSKCLAGYEYNDKTRAVKEAVANILAAL